MNGGTDRTDRSAPPGAQCGQHPERTAHFTCPRCGSYACLFCWHDSLDRCDACLKRDPASAAPPIAWERPELGLAARYLGTLASAFRPVRSAPAFAREDLLPAMAFFVRSALPLAALSGIIPHTRTVLFGPYFQTRFLGEVSSAMLAVDVIRAVALQLAFLLIHSLALSLPYVTLVRAYAPGQQQTALRALLYRLWLVQAAMLLQGLLAWAGPGSQGYILAIWLLPFFAQVLIMLAMGFAARLACGLGMLMSIVVVVVPFLLLVLVEGLFSVGVAALLGPMGDVAPQ